MKQKKSLMQKIFESADLNEESIPRQPLVELLGTNRVLIENHHGVTQYGQERIQVRLNYGAVNVNGNRLQLCQMTRQKLVITGSIDSIELIRGKYR